MKTTTMLLTLCALLATQPACKDDDDEGSSAAGAGGANGGMDSPCPELCAIIEALNCPGDQGSPCGTQCAELWQSPVCQAELRAFLTCSVEAPPSSWECNAGSTEAEPMAGVCADERAAVDTCLDR